MITRFGPFVLDSETRQLTRDEEEIHLSPKAFAVLCALVARRPNVVPKADLFGQIWPDVFVVDVPPGSDTQAMAAEYARLDGVAAAFVDGVGGVAAVPNDP